MAGESGGEEILYPHQPRGSDLLRPFDCVEPSSPVETGYDPVGSHITR